MHNLDFDNGPGRIPFAILSILSLVKCEMPPSARRLQNWTQKPRRTDATPPQLGIRGMTAQIVTWVVSNSIRFDLTPTRLEYDLSTQAKICSYYLFEERYVKYFNVSRLSIVA